MTTDPPSNDRFMALVSVPIGPTEDTDTVRYFGIVAPENDAGMRSVFVYGVDEGHPGDLLSTGIIYRVSSQGLSNFLEGYACVFPAIEPVTYGLFFANRIYQPGVWHDKSGAPCVVYRGGAWHTVPCSEAYP